MRAKQDHRAAAIELRAAGRTYDEIVDELGVSKSSLSLWLRHLPFPTSAQRRDVEEPGAADPLPPAESLDAADPREHARVLRLQGQLLREIAETLGVSVKTACVWCAGLPIPARARHGRDPDLVRQMGRLWWDAELARREAQRVVVKSASHARVGALSDRELELIAVTAYWCEGSKDKPYARRERVTFINSDPGLIRVWMEYLSRQGVGVDDVSFTVSIHESADVGRATRFWADVVGVPPAQLRKPQLKRHNPKTVRKNTGDAYVGCLTINVLGGRLLYQRIEGAWQGIVAGAFSPSDDVTS